MNITELPSFDQLDIFDRIPLEEICDVARVCKLWYALTKNHSFPINLRMLEKVAFHNIDHFKLLQKDRLDVKLRAFAIFQGRIVGQRDNGTLCIYDPKKKTMCNIDFQPPWDSDYPVEFLTSDEACILYYARSHLYEIDLSNQSCQRIKFKIKLHKHNHGLLKNKLITWETTTALSDDQREILLKKYPKRDLLPFLEMEIYDLKDRSITEFTYPTRKPPTHICVQGDNLVFNVGRWIYILDANLKQIEKGTFWETQIVNIHLVGKKLLIEEYSYGTGGVHFSIAIKEAGDARNYGEERKYLMHDSKGHLHPFYNERLGWKFLYCEGIHWKNAIWCIQEGYLTRVNLAQRLPSI